MIKQSKNLIINTDIKLIEILNSSTLQNIYIELKEIFCELEMMAYSFPIYRYKLNGNIMYSMINNWEIKNPEMIWLTFIV